MKLLKNIVILLLLAVGSTGCEDQNPLNLPGYTYGDFVYLSHPSAGKIERVMVSKGDRVKKGQPLVEMENFTAENAFHIAEKNYQAEIALLRNLETGERPEELNIIYSQLERAKSAASLAKNQLERYQQLYRSRVVSTVELQQIKDDYAQKNAQVKELLHQLKAKKLPARSAQIENQKSRVESAKLQRDKASWDLQQNILVAPLDARVFDIIYLAGERPLAGQPVISLLPSDNIKVRFFAPEKILGALRVGMKVKLLCDSCKQPIWGAVSYISPQAEYSPPVIYSTRRREKLLYRVEAMPEKGQSGSINIGQPVMVEILPDE